MTAPSKVATEVADPANRPATEVADPANRPATEIAGKADFSGIRYAQVWEDADALIAGLAIRPGDHCLSIASAGDNALALLTRDPARVVAVDLSPAQLACVEMRRAAYLSLDHPAFLELYGSRESRRRRELYRACRDRLADDDVRAFWDARLEEVTARGFAGIGRFEGYFALFRRWVLPFTHGKWVLREVALPRAAEDRERWYRERFDTWAWRVLIRVFASRTVMGALGRDPAFFDYVEGSVADHVLARVRHTLVDLDPSTNPYLHWVLHGRHGEALPVALRAEHFETIRDRIDRIETRLGAIEEVADQAAAEGRPFQRANLSDIFEYMSEQNTAGLLEKLARAMSPGGRLVYWNMMVPRAAPASLSHMLTALPGLSADLSHRDIGIFYRAMVAEEVAERPG